MYFLLALGMFQPAMLVYQNLIRCSFIGFVALGPNAKPWLRDAQHRHHQIIEVFPPRGLRCRGSTCTTRCWDWHWWRRAVDHDDDDYYCHYYHYDHDDDDDDDDDDKDDDDDDDKNDDDDDHDDHTQLPEHHPEMKIRRKTVTDWSLKIRILPILENMIFPECYCWKKSCTS